MRRGSVFNGPRQTEAMVGFGLELVAGTLQGFEGVAFYRAIVHSGPPNELDENTRAFFDRWDKRGEKGARRDSPQDVFKKLAVCARRNYSLKSEAEDKIRAFLASIEKGKWDEKLDKWQSLTLLDKRVVGPPRSCYLGVNVSNKIDDVVDPFHALKATVPAEEAQVWISKAVMGKPPRKENPRLCDVNRPEVWKAYLCDSWERAVILDLLMRLGNPDTRDAAWRKFEEMGITMNETVKKRLVGHMQGDTVPFAGVRKGAKFKDERLWWDYNDEAFELVRHKWSKNWAHLLAEKFNRSAQGIAIYERGGGIKIPWTEKFGMKVPDTPARDVLVWIRHNTHYGPWGREVNPHSRFLRYLGEYCKASWLVEIHQELEKFSSSLHTPGDDQSREDARKAFVEKIGSMGLSFNPSAMKAITNHIMIKSHSNSPEIRLLNDEAPIKALASHKFEVDSWKVSRKNGTYIEAAFGTYEDDDWLYGEANNFFQILSDIRSDVGSRIQSQIPFGTQ